MDMKDGLQYIKEKLSIIPYYTEKVNQRVGDSCATNQRDMWTAVLSICIEKDFLSKEFIDQLAELYPITNGVAFAKLLAVGPGIIAYLQQKEDAMNLSVASLIKSYKQYEREKEQNISLGGI